MLAVQATHASVDPAPVVRYPAAHTHVDAEAPLVLLAGHGVHELAPASL